MAKTTTILVAATQLVGGTPDARETLEAGEELTSEKQKRLGLSKTDVAGLLARDKLTETTVRVAGASALDPAVTALEKRVEKAEAARDAAIERAEAAEARLAELEKADNPPPAS